MEQPAAATSLQVIVGDMPAAHCPGWSKAVVLNRMIYSNTIFLWACKPRRRHCRRLRRRETGKIGKTQKRIEPSRAASSGAESSVLTARIMQAGELWPREHWILPADVWRKSRAELHEAMFAAGLHGIFPPIETLLFRSTYHTFNWNLEGIFRGIVRQSPPICISLKKRFTFLNYYKNKISKPDNFDLLGGFKDNFLLCKN